MISSIEFPINSNKPGEWAELCHEITNYKNIGVEGMSKKALEFADIAYYCLQPNSEESLESVFMYLFMGGCDLPYLFCVAKYSTRLEFGDRDDYKEIEESVMIKYLQRMRENYPDREWLFS